MSFHKKSVIEVGSKVISTEKIETLAGTFEAGTTFTVTGKGVRGYDLVDDEGNSALEVGYGRLKLL